MTDNTEIYLLYDDGFIAVDGTCWRFIIEQCGGTEPAGHRDTHLTFPADTPAEIEWQSTEKMEAMCSSALTLRVESDTDRRFIDMYRTQALEVRCRVLRDGRPYWCGFLDTELYEEPYSFTDGYDVLFTFSDLGQLKRRRWQRAAGHLCLQDAIGECLAAIGGGIVVPVVYHVATTAVATDAAGADTVVDILHGVSVDAANFAGTDEPMTLYDTLEALLQPFGLRVEQRAGEFHVYDLHTLYTAYAPELVEWDGTDAMLGVDKVYNNVRVTFSPGVDTELIDCSFDYDDTKLNGGGAVDVPVWPDKDEGAGLLKSLAGFTIEYGTPEQLPDGVAEIQRAAAYRITSRYSGSDSAGLVWAFNHEGQYVHDSFCNTTPGYIMRSRRVYIPNLRDAGFTPGSMSNPFTLRVSLDLMADVVENPFERSRDDEESTRNALKRFARFAYVGVALNLYPDSSGGGTEIDTYHYSNYKQAMLTGLIGMGFESAAKNGLIGWSRGEDHGSGSSSAGIDRDNSGALQSDFFLSYYADDREEDTALGGWATNRPAVGRWAGELPSTWGKRGNGEYLDVPPVAGWLELTLYSPVWLGDSSYMTSENLMPVYQSETLGGGRTHWAWMLYKNAKVELRGPSGMPLDDSATDDVEYSAWLLRDAEEELEIQTTVGSHVPGMPMGRGFCLLTRSRSYVAEFSRAGVTASLEKLLIGTVYSQHASRHTTLAGTTLIATGFGTFCDRAMPGVRFMRTGDVQRLREAEAHTTLCELSPELYEGLEYDD